MIRFSVKKIDYFLITVFVLSFFSLFSTRPAEAFSGGVGTSGDPYQITTPAELASLSSYLGSGNSGKYFRLMNDINLDVSPYNSGSGWTPIGTSSGSSAFYGKFNGDYHTITGLFISAPSTGTRGLFGYAAAGAVNDR